MNGIDELLGEFDNFTQQKPPKKIKEEDIVDEFDNFMVDLQDQASQVTIPEPTQFEMRDPTEGLNFETMPSATTFSEPYQDQPAQERGDKPWYKTGVIPEKISAFSRGFQKSLPFVDKLSTYPEYKKREIKEQDIEFQTDSPKTFMAGGITGHITQAMTGAGGVGKLLTKTVISKSPLLMSTLSRVLPAVGLRGAHSIEEVIDNKTDIGNALFDTIVESGGGAAFSIVPELVFPPGVTQAIAQPLADVVYQAGVDAMKQGGDTSGIFTKDWFKKQIPTIAMSLGFGIKDAADSGFKDTQKILRNELLGKTNKLPTKVSTELSEQEIDANIRSDYDIEKEDYLYTHSGKQEPSKPIEEDSDIEIRSDYDETKDFFTPEEESKSLREYEETKKYVPDVDELSKMDKQKFFEAPTEKELLEDFDKLQAVNAETKTEYNKQQKPEKNDVINEQKSIKQLDPEVQNTKITEDDFKRKKGFMAQSGSIGSKKQYKPDLKTKEAIDMQVVFDKQRSATKEKFKFNLGKSTDKWLSRIVDEGAPWKRKIGKNIDANKVIVAHNLSRGASGEAARSYELKEKDIYSNISHDQENVLSDFIQAKRSVELLKLKGSDFKTPGGDKNNKWLNDLKNSDPTLYKTLSKAQQKYVNAVGNDPINELVKEGILSKESANKLLSEHKNYSPRRFLKHIDPDSEGFTSGGNRMTNPDSGIQRLKDGDEEALINNPRLLLGEIEMRTKNRIFKNRANKELYNFVANNPDNKLGSIVEEPKHKKVSVETAKQITDELMSIKIKLQKRISSPLSVEKRLGLEEKINKFEEKIDDLLDEKELKELNVEDDIKELQGQIINIKQDLRRPLTSKERKFEEEKINKLEEKINKLSSQPQTIDIDIKIKDYETKIKNIEEKIDKPLTGSQIEKLNTKIESVTNKIDNWAQKIKISEEKGESDIKLFGKSYGSVPSGMTRISSFVDGKKQSVLMPTEIAKYWIGQEPKINSNLAKFLNVISGSAILKPMATGLNPGFAISNTARDIMHSWFSTKEYSPIMPVAWAQQAKDFMDVAGDVIKRKGRVIDYIKDGGSMELLTQQGQLQKEPWKPQSAMGESFNQLQKTLGWVGETSELITRIALRERAIKNGKTPQEATEIARNYIDFAQGGTWSKAASHAVPYLNAGIQGTRGIFRSFKNDPKIASIKAAQILSMGFALAYWNRKTNEEAWDSVSDRDKVTNYIITTPFHRTDSDGNKRHIYFKIAKDQGQRMFGTFGEELSEMIQTGKINFEKIKHSIKDFIPVNIGVSIPTFSSFWGYMYNKDFWRNQDIWKGRKGISPKEEQWNETPKIWKVLGNTTGLSPERSMYAFHTVVPKNIYTYALGGMAGEMMSTLSEKERESISKPFIEQISKIPISKRFVGETYPHNKQTEDLLKRANKMNMKLNKMNGKSLSYEELKRKVTKEERIIADNKIRNDREFDFLATAAIIGNDDTKKNFKTSYEKLMKNNPREYRRIRNRLKRKFGTDYFSLIQSNVK